MVRSVVLKLPSEVRDAFWALKQGTMEERRDSSLLLLNFLIALQSSQEEQEVSFDEALAYVTRRCCSALLSNAGHARASAASLLCALSRRFQVPLVDVFTEVVQKDDELRERDVTLARAYLTHAIARTPLCATLTLDNVRSLLSFFLSDVKEAKWAHELCVSAAEALLLHVDVEHARTVCSEMAQHSELSSQVKKVSFEQVSLALMLDSLDRQRHLHLSVDTQAYLMVPLLEAPAPLYSRLFRRVLNDKTGPSVNDLWRLHFPMSDQVDKETLRSLQSAVQVLPSLVPISTKLDEILDERFLLLIRNNLANKSGRLHATVSKHWQQFIEAVGVCTDVETVESTLRALLSSANFDQTTHTRSVATLVSHLCSHWPVHALRFMESQIAALCDTANGEERHVILRVLLCFNSAVAQLLNEPQREKGRKTWLDTQRKLRDIFLFCGFFEFADQELSFSVPHGELPEPARVECRSAFWRVMRKSEAEPALKLTAELIEKCRLVSPNEATEAAITNSTNSLVNLEFKDSDKPVRELISHVALSALDSDDDEEHAQLCASSCSDLCIALEQGDSGDDESSFAQLLVDVLLSLMVKDSALLRQVGKDTLKATVTQLTEAALSDLLTALGDTTSSAEVDMRDDVEEEDEEENEEDEEDDEFAPISPAEFAAAQARMQDDGEDEEEENEDDEELTPEQALKELMADAVDVSAQVEEAKLAEAVGLHVQNRSKRKQELELMEAKKRFLLRVCDLCEAAGKAMIHAKRSLVLDMLLPLLEVQRRQQKKKPLAPVAKRIKEVVQTLARAPVASILNDGLVEMEQVKLYLVDALDFFILRADNDTLRHSAAHVCALLCKCALALSDDSDETKMWLAMRLLHTLSEVVVHKKAPFVPQVWLSLLQRVPPLRPLLAPRLAERAVQAKNEFLALHALTLSMEAARDHNGLEQAQRQQCLRDTLAALSLALPALCGLPSEEEHQLEAVTKIQGKKRRKELRKALQALLRACRRADLPQLADAFAKRVPLAQI
ncbi:MAG: hypothetical protein MHM6MM_004374 [Cercozoa sp. M6MM]